MTRKIALHLALGQINVARTCIDICEIGKKLSMDTGDHDDMHAERIQSVLSPKQFEYNMLTHSLRQCTPEVILKTSVRQK